MKDLQQKTQECMENIKAFEEEINKRLKGVEEKIIVLEDFLIPNKYRCYTANENRDKDHKNFYHTKRRNSKENLSNVPNALGGEIPFITNIPDAAERKAVAQRMHEYGRAYLEENKDAIERNKKREHEEELFRYYKEHFCEIEEAILNLKQSSLEASKSPSEGSKCDQETTDAQ